MVIQCNLQAMNANRSQGIVRGKQASLMEKLSSGFRINRSADDAAGLSISEKMRFQIRGLEQGADNINEGVNYCQVADGALNEIQDMLQRMNELSIQAANGTNSSKDREYIDEEVQQLKAEIDRICVTTKYNEEYIFKCKDSVDMSKEVYKLDFSGYPNDLYIYNDTYDDATGTATYGGIAYRGKRYAWSSISPNMYDSATGMFRKGKYTLKGDDGSYLTLVCEAGSEPPQVSREFVTSADEKGIYVNGELIAWEEVKNSSGQKFDSEDFLAEPYYFNYHGVTTSFTPDYMDSYEDVLNKLSGTRWKSTYKIPVEDTALYADFSKTYAAFVNNSEVKKFLNGIPVLDDAYILHAGDGTNGTFDGVWIEHNNSILAGSQKTWAEIGISNWGDGSEDIWADITYKYIYDQTNSTQLGFTFQVINEISKDSVIDALDNVNLTQVNGYELDNYAEVDVDKANSNILSALIGRDTIDITLEEEYELGRDYSTGKDEFGREDLMCDGRTFSVNYNGIADALGDGNITQKKYSNTQAETNAIVNSIKAQIKSDMGSYLEVIKARYFAGASEPGNINLAALISGNNITGNGGNTYLEDAVTFDFTDASLNATQTFSNTTTFAGASIDFSGLGNTYELADLIGMGFNSTCQTCNNHYSIQFTTLDVTNAAWKSVSVAGNTYGYSYEKQGNDHTLYIDIQAMRDSGAVNDGVAFTNTLLGIIKDAGYDFHYTQYATYDNNAVLYLYDNRPQYAENGVSTATEASFSPYAYAFNSIAEFELNLFDESDMTEGISVRYEYDYSELYESDRLYFETQLDNSNGKYIYNNTTQKYELYDASNAAHAGKDRYNITDIRMDTQGQSMDEYLEDFIRNEIFADIAGNTEMALVSAYAKYRIEGRENPNKAMVTEYNTPIQIMPTRWVERERTEYLRIQCSSNIKDNILIEKQKLSVQRMGLGKLSVALQGQATRAIDAIGEAIEKVSTIRSLFGSYQNRLEHAHAINLNTHENTQAAESVIRDTDIPETMVEYSNTKILQEAGVAMLTQANQSNQAVLSLL